MNELVHLRGTFFGCRVPVERKGGRCVAGGYNLLPQVSAAHNTRS